MTDWTKEKTYVFSPENALKSCKCLQGEGNEKWKSFCPWVPERFRHAVFSNIWRQGCRIGLKTGELEERGRWYTRICPPALGLLPHFCRRLECNPLCRNGTRQALNSGTLGITGSGGEPPHTGKGMLGGPQIKVLIIISGLSQNSERRAYNTPFRPETGGFLLCESNQL